jgi:hypothetical protein
MVPGQPWGKKVYEILSMAAKRWAWWQVPVFPAMTGSIK